MQIDLYNGRKTVLVVVVVIHYVLPNIMFFPFCGLGCICI